MTFYCDSGIDIIFDLEKRLDEVRYLFDKNMLNSKHANEAI
jgi:hypothetical protein